MYTRKRKQRKGNKNVYFERRENITTLAIECPQKSFLNSKLRIEENINIYIYIYIFFFFLIHNTEPQRVSLYYYTFDRTPTIAGLCLFRPGPMHHFRPHDWSKEAVSTIIQNSSIRCIRKTTNIIHWKPGKFTITAGWIPLLRFPGFPVFQSEPLCRSKYSQLLWSYSVTDFTLHFFLLLLDLKSPSIKWMLPIVCKVIVGVHEVLRRKQNFPDAKTPPRCGVTWTGT
jgi:hypothetical protein